MNKVDKYHLKRKLLGIFASVSFFVFGAYILFCEGNIDFESVFKAFKIGLLAAAITGFIGYLMGHIIETPPKSQHSKDQQNSDLLIDDVMIEDLESLDSDTNS